MPKAKNDTNKAAKAQEKAKQKADLAAQKALKKAADAERVRADSVEYEKRIRTVQEWIIDDWPSVDIIAQIFLKWQIEERQAKRYISEARSRWVAEESLVVDHKRRLKIQTLKKLKRSLKDSFKGTPAGIRAIMFVEKEIIKLEGTQPAKKLELTGKDGADLSVGNNVTTVVMIKNPHDDNSNK